MKNALQYYYHLSVDEIHQTDGIYKFNIQDQLYALIPFYENLEYANEVYKLSIKLLQKGIYCHQILLNQEQKIVTMINNNPYILLKSYSNLDKKITLEQIIQFTSSTKEVEYTDYLRRDKWEILWSEKIDYFEYQINQFGKSHPKIRESFSYFVGLAETGISVLSQFQTDYKNLGVCHKRIKKNQTLFDLYNPLNFVIDWQVRDVSEYFKESFVRNKNILSDIQYYLTHTVLTTYEYQMFFARMLYPSFYFDLYEEIINGNKEDDLIDPIIQLASDYESLLKKLYIWMSGFTTLPDIEWLKKI